MFRVGRNKKGQFIKGHILFKGMRRRKHFLEYQKMYNKNRRDLKENYYIYSRTYLKEWKKYLPIDPKCEICNKKLKYLSGKRQKSVYFDHKTSNFKKILPFGWLINHSPFKQKNIKQWKIFNFGILCNRCNLILPQRNRRKWLNNAMRYANGI